MTFSYTNGNRTGTFTLTVREDKILRWVISTYSIKAFTDFLDSWFNSKEEEAKQNVRLQIDAVLTDPDVIAVLRAKGVSL